MKTSILVILILAGVCMIGNISAQAQIGRRFPSERKVVTDPVTGTELIFLTSTPTGDSKIYQTHNQWTSDSQWLIFRSDRVKAEVMAVNEKQVRSFNWRKVGEIRMQSVFYKVVTTMLFQTKII